MLHQNLNMAKKLIQNCLTLKHSYQYYIKDLTKESKYFVSYKTYVNICKDFNKEIMSNIIEDGDFFKMPYRLGDIRIKKRKIDFKNLKPDFGLFNKSDTSLKNKFLNEHSDNYYVRFYWNKNINTLVKNKTAYCFIPTRTNKRTLAKLLKEKQLPQINKYFE